MKNKDYITIHINKKTLKLIGKVILGVLLFISLLFIAFTCFKSWMGIDYDRGYQDGKNKIINEIIEFDNGYSNQIIFRNNSGTTRTFYVNEYPIHNYWKGDENLSIRGTGSAFEVSNGKLNLKAYESDLKWKNKKQNTLSQDTS